MSTVLPAAAAFAGSDDYPYRGGTIDATDRWGFYTRECVSFAAWRLNNNNRTTFTNNGWGSAVNWANVARSRGIRVDSQPAPGSVAWWSSGHVAWVESVNPDDSVVVEDYNYRIPPGDERWIYHQHVMAAAGLQFIHIADFAPPRARRPDLIKAVFGGTRSGRMELHGLSSDSGYSIYNRHIVTPDGPGSARYVHYQIGDFNGDGHKDIIRIQTDLTGSGVSEVHILDGTNPAASYLLHATIPVGYSSNEQVAWKVLDYDRDGRIDIVAIGMNNTGSGRTEVHILSGASGYQSFIEHAATADTETQAAVSRFAPMDDNGDGVADIVRIQVTQTSSNQTELHGLNGADRFQSFTNPKLTAEGWVDLQNVWLGEDFDADGIADIWKVQMAGTGSGQTEVHVLSAASGFQSYAAHIATPEGPGDWESSTWLAD